MANKLKTLQRSSDFQKIRSGGLKSSVSRWLTMAYSKNNEELFRVGWTLTRKVGNSVTRNRLKRWSREFFRKKSDKLLAAAIDVNLIFRPMPEEFYDDLTHKEFDFVMEKTLARIVKKYELGS